MVTNLVAQLLEGAFDPIKCAIRAEQPQAVFEKSTGIQTQSLQPAPREIVLGWPDESLHRLPRGSDVLGSRLAVE